MWNQETVGDIFESLNGIQHLLLNYNVPKLHSFPHAFVTFLHDWCYAIYKFFVATAWRHTDIDYLRSIFFLDTGHSDTVLQVD